MNKHVVAVAFACAIGAIGAIGAGGAGGCSTSGTSGTTTTTFNESKESAVAREQKESGPVLLENVRVWGHPSANAVLIAGARIEKIGDARELRAWTASSSRDMGGGLVLPGFHDGHIHMLSGGTSLTQLDLTGAKTLDEVLARVQSYAKEHPEQSTPWILGRGWSYDIVPKGTFPTAAMLERVAPGRAIALDAYDGHTSWLSAKALALSNITRTTKDPVDGTIARDATGEPMGALLEGATMLPKIPLPSRDDKKRALAAAARSCVERGITSADAIEADLDTYRLLVELDREGQMPLSLDVFLPIEGDLDAYVAARQEGTARVRLVGTKGFVDGVVEAKTAFMKTAYATGGGVGRPLLEPSRLFALVDESAKRGLVVALHAIGDGAVALSLEAFERLPSALAKLPHRIEHIEVLDAKDAARFAKAGVVASMQPYHAVPGEPDPDAGAWSENLGATRLKERTFAWRTLLAAGATLSFGSDWPVFTHDPLAGLAVALSRKNESGTPKDGWNAHQRVTAAEAIAAYARGRTVDEGQPADLVVLPATVRLEDATTLWNVKPTLVLVDGA
jgi:predicted amidohydrolase YtcJ